MKDVLQNRVMILINKLLQNLKPSAHLQARTRIDLFLWKSSLWFWYFAKVLLRVHKKVLMWRKRRSGDKLRFSSGSSIVYTGGSQPYIQQCNPCEIIFLHKFKELPWNVKNKVHYKYIMNQFGCFCFGIFNIFFYFNLKCTLFWMYVWKWHKTSYRNCNQAVYTSTKFYLHQKQLVGFFLTRKMTCVADHLFAWNASRWCWKDH